MQIIKLVFALILGILLSGNVLQAQLIEDSISMETNYSHQVFYSLDNGEIAQIENNDWDIAFACFQRGAAGSAILLNESTSQLWSYPNDTSAWSVFDTTGFKNWEPLLNSDTSWTNGAFNKHRGAKGTFDMGWGELNPRNNFWTFGDSLYLIQLQDNSFRKLWIVSLKTGIWEFKYANIDGSNEQQFTIDKNDFPYKNFIYHSLISDKTIDREPDNSLWDIMFTKHVDEVLPDFYLPVTSVFNNRNIWSAKNNTPDYNTAVMTNSPTTSFNQNINNIGREWKRFASATGWTVYDSIAYFIYDQDSSNFYRLVFTEFEGRATGKAFFVKELLQKVSTNSTAQRVTLSIFPNPATENVNLLVNYPKNDKVLIQLINLSGQIVYNENKLLYNGINKININTQTFQTGYYILKMSNKNFTGSHKLVIK